MPLTIDTYLATQLLKERTSVAHVLGSTLIPKLISIQNFNDYAVILRMFYGFGYPVQENIRTYITIDLLADIEERKNLKPFITT